MRLAGRAILLAGRAIPPADGSRFPVDRVAAAPASEFVTLSIRWGRRPQDAGVARRLPAGGIRRVEIGVIL